MREWLQERPVVADATLAGFLLSVGIVSVRLWPVRGESSMWVVRDLLVVSLFAPFAFRRRAPRVVLAVVCVASVGIWVGGFFGATTVVACGLAFYGLGRLTNRCVSLRSFFPAAGFVAVASGVVSLIGDGSPWFSLLGRCGVVVTAFAVGDSQRSRAAVMASERQEADRTEALRVAQAERAIVEQRGRLARELHDVVAHSISVMVVQATAAELMLPRQPDSAAASIRNVAEVGRRALTEMRHIFDVLGRGENASEFAPQPTLAELDAIVDSCRATGMSVSFESVGDPPMLSAATELAVVRIVQEALTNALKHASGAATRVELIFGSDVTIEVRDSGRGGGVLTDGRGRGLIGMRERVEALGGELTTGWCEDGGFRVHAVLPVTSPCTQSPIKRMADLATERAAEPLVVSSGPTA